MSEIVVRPAVPADASQMAEVHVQAWRETYRGYLGDDVLDAPDFVERRERMWLAALSDDRHVTHQVAVAELDGTLVGIASSGPAPDADASTPRQLYVLYLLAAHQGSGAGQALLDAVVDAQPTSLWVADPNPRAQAFYLRNGFRFDGAVASDEPRELRMVRPAR